MFWWRNDPPRVEYRRLKALVEIEDGTRPFPYTPVVPFPTFPGHSGGGTEPHEINPRTVNEGTPGCLREMVPVAETDVRSAFITAIELVQEQSELGLSGDPAPFDSRVGREVIVRGHDGPQMGNLHRNGTVQGINLSIASVVRRSAA